MTMNVIIITSDVTSHECIERWEGYPYEHRK